MAFRKPVLLSQTRFGKRISLQVAFREAQGSVVRSAAHQSNERRGFYEIWHEQDSLPQLEAGCSSARGYRIQRHRQCLDVRAWLELSEQVVPDGPDRTHRLWWRWRGLSRPRPGCQGFSSSPLPSGLFHAVQERLGQLYADCRTPAIWLVARMALGEVAMNVSKRKNRPQGPVFLGFGRRDRIRTCDLLVPNETRYQAALHSEFAKFYSKTFATQGVSKNF